MMIPMSLHFDMDIPERPLEPPEPEENPRCPCCGEECETLYRAGRAHCGVRELHGDAGCLGVPAFGGLNYGK